VIVDRHCHGENAVDLSKLRGRSISPCLFSRQNDAAEYCYIGNPKLGNSGDEKVRLWDLNTGKQYSPLKGQIIRNSYRTAKAWLRATKTAYDFGTP